MLKKCKIEKLFSRDRIRTWSKEHFRRLNWSCLSTRGQKTFCVFVLDADGMDLSLPFSMKIQCFQKVKLESSFNAKWHRSTRGVLQCNIGIEALCKSLFFCTSTANKSDRDPLALYIEDLFGARSKNGTAANFFFRLFEPSKDSSSFWQYVMRSRVKTHVGMNSQTKEQKQTYDLQRQVFFGLRKQWISLSNAAVSQLSLMHKTASI